MIVNLESGERFAVWRVKQLDVSRQLDQQSGVRPPPDVASNIIALPGMR